jgi:MHS family proline/betaine transporter-like MFS transporter
MMPTLVTAASATMTDIPRTLAIATACIYVVYLIGSLVIRETKGEMQ